MFEIVKKAWNKTKEIIADKAGFMNDLVQVVAGVAVLIITIVIAMFLGQTFSNALTIANNSAFYYASTFTTYIPTILTLVFAVVLVFLGVLALYALKGLMSNRGSD